MWMTREEISEALGIVPNSVRGKVNKGQLERKVENGKNYYRVIDHDALKRVASRKKPKAEEPVDQAGRREDALDPGFCAVQAQDASCRTSPCGGGTSRRIGR